MEFCANLHYLMVLVPSGLVLKFIFMVLVSSDSAQICIYGPGPQGSTLLYGNINCASNFSFHLVKTTCKYDNYKRSYVDLNKILRKSLRGFPSFSITK